MQQTNIAVLIIWSILVSKAPRHTNMVGGNYDMFFGYISFDTVQVSFNRQCNIQFYNDIKTWDYMQNERGNQRLREWWDSIPVEIVDKDSDSSKVIGG